MVDTLGLGIVAREECQSMPKTRRRYPVEFRAEMVRLVRAGRTPGELSREFKSRRTRRSVIG